jgi:hypothetical protein
MTLSLQPNADGSPGDYDVLSGTLRIGKIYKPAVTHSKDTEWTWVFNGLPEGPSGLVVAGFAQSREGAEAALRGSWEQWLEWAELSEAGH